MAAVRYGELDYGRRGLRDRDGGRQVGRQRVNRVYGGGGIFGQVIRTRQRVAGHQHGGSHPAHEDRHNRDADQQLNEREARGRYRRRLVHVGLGHLGAKFRGARHGCETLAAPVVASTLIVR